MIELWRLGETRSAAHCPIADGPVMVNGESIRVRVDALHGADSFVKVTVIGV